MSLWDRIVGQARAEPILKSAAASPSGAYLFAGPRGVGKREAARVFAAAMLCDAACGDCQTCRRILAGAHPDVQSFHPEGFTYPLALIREVVASAARSPLEGSRRVFILEEADRITERSQNALLKALEEPSSSVVWVLVADRLDPFLPTILSRCQLIEFSPIPEEELRRVVTDRSELPPSEVSSVVRASRGDLSRAMALATDPDARSVRALAIKASTAGRMQPLQALSIADELAEMVEKVAKNRAEKQAAELEELEGSMGAGRSAGAARKRMVERQKREQRRTATEVRVEFLGWLGSSFRDLASSVLGAPREAIVNDDHAEALGAAAPARSPNVWLDLAERTNHTVLAIFENANADLAVESVLLELCR